ncbi:MAG TPA: TonB-dependent receptor [Terriglobia bacterium]|nr:TonB-dependent receptor [Terriglobia bacterium]
MYSRSIRSCLLFMIGASMLVTVVARRADSQVLYGSVSGTISDPSGAVVPGAQATIVNDTTGFTRTATSDAQGLYRLLDLTEGTYTLTVSASGFQATKRTGISVVIGQVNTLDIQMSVGAVSQEVTVQASAAVLQTQKADVHTEISSYAVQNLPLNTYRNFQAAELLAPGVFSTSGISNSYPNSIADTPERSFEIYSNGLPAHDNTTRVDGATNIFIWLPDHMLVVPPQESVEEVNVQTANYDVEKGLTAGAAIDVVTKSGTNLLHGSAYGFHTDDALNAKNWYNHGSNTGILNNDGVAVGGPIKKDKLFFFGNWDGSWQHQAEGFTDLIPTDDLKNGDFSKYLGATVAGVNVCTTEGATVPLQQGMVFDPTTGKADGTGRCVFSSGGQINVIPSNRLNSGAMSFNKLIPEPNINLGVITTGTPYNIIGAKAARPLSRQIYTGRIDWNQSQNHTIWGKWSGQDANFFEPFDLGAAGGNGSGTAHQFAQVATIGHTWTLSPTLILTGHVGWDRMSEYGLPPGYGKPLGQSVLGIVGSNTPAGDIRYTGLPGVSVQGFSGMGSLNSWEPDNRNDWTLTTSHNLTWIKSAHELRMGVDISHNHLNAFQPEIFCCPRGNVVEDYGGTALNTTGLTSGGNPVTLTPFVQNSYAMWDLGLISEAQNDAQFIKSTGKDTQFALYFGDRWKVSSKLTADLGVRWEYFPLITRDGEDKGELFDTATGLLHFGGLGNNPIHNGITTSKKLFMPRIGLAYQIDSKTVARAGFGMSDDTTPLERPLRGFYPLAIGADVFDTSSASEASACKGQASGSTCYNPYSTFGAVAGNPYAVGLPVIQVPNISSGTIVVPSDNTIGTLGPGPYHRGYVESWNLFVERKLPSDFLFSVGYVGNHYVHEFNGRPIDAAPLYGVEPSFGGVQYTGGVYQFQGYLDSHYNSLQVSINHRSSHGLFVQAAYTYSKAMGYVNDNTWENGLEFNCTPSAAMPQGCQQLNYGPLSFDHTQNFKLAFVYDLPFGEGKSLSSNSKAANAILGGWKFNGVFTAFTGAPLQLGQDVSNINTYGTSAVPNHVAPVQYLGAANNSQGHPQWFNSSAFAPNLSATSIGNIGRTESWLRGPGLWQFDPSLARIFKLTERFNLEVRAEAENVFNTPHFQSINTGCTTTASTTGGAPTCGVSFGSIGGSYGQRVVQFGAFIRF